MRLGMDFLLLLLMMVFIPAFYVGYTHNPIYSVLSLIGVFLASAVLLISLDVEFLAMVFLVVYIGAIAVLFLFVVMMLNIKISSSRSLSYHFFALFLSFGFGFFIIKLLNGIFSDYYLFGEYKSTFVSTDWVNRIDFFNNITVLGQVIYTFNVISFVLAGFILLVAMFGSIVLTLHHRQDVRRQAVYVQLHRDAYKTVQLSKNRKFFD